MYPSYIWQMLYNWSIKYDKTFNGAGEAKFARPLTKVELYAEKFYLKLITRNPVLIDSDKLNNEYLVINPKTPCDMMCK